MKLRHALLACASLSVCVPAIAQDNMSLVADSRLVADAKAFGAREAVLNPDLSADGSRVIFVTPGAGRASVAVIENLDGGQYNQVVSASGNPDILRWCAFASGSRAVCKITGTTLKSIANEPIGYSRLVSITTMDLIQSCLARPTAFMTLRCVNMTLRSWIGSTVPTTRC